MINSCAICSSDTYSRTDKKGRIFHFCSSCSFVSLDSSFYLSFEEERSRYELHNNNRDDEGYTMWLNSFIEKAVEPFVSPGSRILDFGSGPQPVLAGLLREKGYAADIYDSHFHDRPFSGLYNMITATEVFEHISSPLSAAVELKKNLHKGGYLSIKTSFRPEDDNTFLKWWYKEDSTHISFFFPRSLHILSELADLSVHYCDNSSIVIFKN